MNNIWVHQICPTYLGMSPCFSAEIDNFCFCQKRLMLYLLFCAPCFQLPVHCKHSPLLPLLEPAVRSAVLPCAGPTWWLADSSRLLWSSCMKSLLFHLQAILLASRWSFQKYTLCSSPWTRIFDEPSSFSLLQLSQGGESSPRLVFQAVCNRRQLFYVLLFGIMSYLHPFSNKVPSKEFCLLFPSGFLNLPTFSTAASSAGVSFLPCSLSLPGFL